MHQNDVLLLRQQGARHPKWHLTGPIRPDTNVKLSYGASVPAADLVGRSLLDVVCDSKGNSVRLHDPSLASYILRQPQRLATPIYPHDANTIVSLLDLHPSRPGEEDEESDAPPLEIFEAGTGMGSLTLHLARAIHAGNPPVPRALRRALCNAGVQHSLEQDPGRAKLDLSAEDQMALDTYAASRRVVIHTLDRNLKHANGAIKLVRNFRRALYLPSVDFHVGSIRDFFSVRLEQSGGKPFLSHAVLDLPAAHEHAELIVRALHLNGFLVVFQPSISQIAEFDAWIKQTGQGLKLEKVLELPFSTKSEGVDDTGGGKAWDIRTTIPKVAEGDPAKTVQVMRPRVGEYVVGGGFVALLRRWPKDSAQPVTPDVAEETADLTKPSPE
ncbi:hypothetical protein HIM_02913 [Hirsutella minnesotensis 3608]|nr:hypothetical protein HIM_02913 [Hirsutella minnesotensis 3608]